MPQLPIGTRVDEHGNAVAEAVLPAGTKVDENGNVVTTPPASTQDNFLQRALDKIAGVVSNSSQMPLGTGGVAANAIRTLAHPMDNAPAIGGAAGAGLGAGAGTVFGMGVGAVPGAIGGATLGGASGEALRQLYNRLTGHAAPSTMQDAATGIAKEGGINGALAAAGEAVPLAGRVLKSGAQHAAMNAVAPSTRMLSDVVDPVTGRSGLIPGEAANIFRKNILDVAPGVPGSLTQAKNLQQQIEAASAAKNAAIANAPAGTVIDRDMPPDVFLKNVENARTAGDPTAAARQIEQAKLGYDNRQVLAPNAATPAGIPAMQPMAASHYTPAETQAQIKGMDAELNRLYDQQNAARTTNRPLAPNFDAQTLQTIRAELAQRLEHAVPDVAAPNAYMHQAIPYRDAIEAATAPRYHNTLPASISDSVMRAVRGSQALAARPMEALAKPMMTSSGAQNAALLRLAMTLAQNQGQ